MEVIDKNKSFHVTINAKKNIPLIILIPILIFVFGFFDWKIALIPIFLGGYIIQWMFFGKEIIQISDGILTVKKELFSFSKELHYDINEIQEIRRNRKTDAIEQDFEATMSISNYFSNDGLLKFDYGMKTVKFADEISEKEAEILLEKLKNRIKKSHPEDTSEGSSKPLRN